MTTAHKSTAHRSTAHSHPTAVADGPAGGASTAPLDRFSSEVSSPPATPLAHALFPLAFLWVVWGGLSSATALTLGLCLAWSLDPPWRSHSKRLANGLLKGGVIGLGFGMHLPDVLQVGRDGLVMAAVTIAVTLAGGYLVGRWLRVEERVSALISVGTAICGGSAIAAMAAVLVALEGEIAIALGTVFLLNAAALYVFPWLGGQLGLDSTEFGMWAGVAIHDMSSVVGASSEYGLDALHVATAVKMSRTLWIVPVVLGASFWLRRRQWAAVAGAEGAATEGAATVAGPKLPLFIGGFILASLSRTYVPGVVEMAPWLTLGARRALSAALFVIGAGMPMAALRRVGWRPLVQGIVLWLVISLLSLGFVILGR